MNTTYIIIGVVIVVGIVLFMFRHTIFGDKQKSSSSSSSSSSPVIVPVPTPTPTPVPTPNMAKKTFDQAQQEAQNMVMELVTVCGGMDAQVTKDCYNIVKSRIPKIKELINSILTLNDPKFTEGDKKQTIKFIEFINKLEPQLTDDLYENMIKGKTLEQVMVMVSNYAE